MAAVLELIQPRVQGETLAPPVLERKPTDFIFLNRAFLSITL